MNLLTQAASLIHWVLQILWQCFRVAPRTTFTVVGYAVVARATRMLAFLLPLKVILLAGSERVPRYFHFLLSPEHRDAGVVVLSAAAILCYALTLVLEARTKQLSEVGSADLLAASGVMSLVANQRAEMQGFYARFTQVATGMLFAAVGLVVIAALDHRVALCLVGLCLCFYLLTAWALHGVTPLRRGRLPDLIIGRLGNYLGILSSVAFLCSFLAILYPFVTGTQGNILIAIICVALLRQVLSALTGSIKDAVSLAGQRQLIDTLVFPHHRLQTREPKDQRTLRDLFGKGDREAKIAEELAGLSQAGQRLRIEWRDAAIRGMAEFSITAEGGKAPVRHFRQRVFPPRLKRMIENEDLLFRHIDREAVWAPPVVHRFVHGEYECVVCEAGNGKTPSAAKWRALKADFVANLWGMELPPALVRIYSSSHRFLHERLTEEFVSRMDIAIDTEAEADGFRRFHDALPAIRDQIGKIPLRLVNSSFAREQTVARADGGLHVLEWGQWSIEPIGTALPSGLVDDRELGALLDKLRRPAMLDASVTLAHLRLVRDCGLLERAILRGTMKAALRHAALVADDLEAIVRAGRAAEPDQAVKTA